MFYYAALPPAIGPLFEQTLIYIISETFHVNMSYSGSVVLEKKDI
jgi:hypothetical protein